MAYSLLDLPSDVIHIIAGYLLPTDLLYLISTCRTLFPMFGDRAVWLQIAETISHSRPIAYTAMQAQNADIGDLALALMRAQLLAQQWAQTSVRAQKEVRIAFPDNRIINYFTFLPGSKHVLIYDMYNVISCWMVKGHPLRAWRADRGAKLIRWKPLDEMEMTASGYEGWDGVIEITLESTDPSTYTRCEILLLAYLDDYAKFKIVASFRIPRVFEPFSAMTQDELYGALVGIPSGPHDRVGIYITDKDTEKAICIDTGLPLTFNHVPQALLSSSHLVLYTETLQAAQFVTYDLVLLRGVLKNWGLQQDDPELNWAIKVTSEACTIPFETVTTECKHALMPPCYHCGGVFTAPTGSDLSSNCNPYPVIIPKWTTLRENLGRHRTRSVVTLSRCVRPEGNNDPVLDDLVAFQNGATANGQGINEHTNQVDELGNGGNAGEIELAELGNFPGDPHLQPHIHFELAPHPQAAVHFPELHPRELTTITHHYFDNSPSGSEPSTLKRTVLAQALLRRPSVLRLPWPPLPPQEPEWIAAPVRAKAWNNETQEEDGSDGDTQVFVDSISPEGAPSVSSADLTNDTVSEVTDAVGALQISVYDAPTVEDIGASQSSTVNGPPVQAEALQLSVDDAWPAELGEALQPSMDEPDEPPVDELLMDDDTPPLFDEQLLNLQPLNVVSAQALADLATDPFGGSLVIGYGGRCALWVEERQRQQGGPEPVLRLATFPAYEGPPDRYNDGHQNITIHPELERGNGHVATLHVSDRIALDSAYAYDLDDIHGLVGIATSLGELWIVDCVHG